MPVIINVPFRIPPIFVRTLGGAGSDFGVGVAVDSSGGVCLVGDTSAGVGGGDALISKYNSAGILQWQRALGGSGAEDGGDIATDGSGNIYITGLTSSQGAGNSDIFVSKYNSSGVIQWQRAIGGANTETQGGVAVDTSGNLHVTGNTLSAGSGGNTLTAKYDTSGVIQWQRTLGDNNSEQSYGIAVDNSSGDVYIVGIESSGGVAGQNLLIAKYNSSGTIQWQRNLAAAGVSDEGYGIALDSSSNVYVVGKTNSSGSGDALIAKYDSSGVIQWQRTLGGGGSEILRRVAVDSSGNSYVIGTTFSSGAGGSDFLIAKYDTSGVIQWQRAFGGTGTEEGRGISFVAPNTLYVTGRTDSAGAGGDDLLIVKIPADGTGTGTFGPFTYQSISLTEQAGALTDGATTFADAAAGLTDQSTTLTDQAISLTDTGY